jgi:predicted RNA binding protein YcfA (HicA-like mRNA interferase family)
MVTMANAVDRKTVERWLLGHGFELRPGGKTSHRQYVRSGVVVTLPGHGRQALSKKHVGMILRQLERAGFPKDDVRRALQEGL